MPRRVNVDRLIQRYMDRWIANLSLGGWRITWAISDKPIICEGEAVAAASDYHILDWHEKVRHGRRKGKIKGVHGRKKVAHIRFDREDLTSATAIERLVVHELLHLYDHGLGNSTHKMIYRLELVMIRMRKKLRKAA